MRDTRTGQCKADRRKELISPKRPATPAFATFAPPGPRRALATRAAASIRLPQRGATQRFIVDRAHRIDEAFNNETRRKRGLSRGLIECESALDEH